jgi:hypothetical protein
MKPRLNWPECQVSRLEENWRHPWRDLNIAVQYRFPSNVIDLERICREEWEKPPKYRCAKLVASYPRRL